MNSQMQDCRYVPVRVDGQLYCFDNQVIRSVALGSDCELFDESLPGGIAGEANYAGAEIPVLRLRSLLQTSSTPAPHREHLVVTQTDQGFCGFLVDDVYRAREFAPQDLQPLPAPATTLEHPFFEGIARLPEYSTSDDATQAEAEKTYLNPAH